jgi:hypothetical protein
VYYGEKNQFSFFLFRVLWTFLRGAGQNHFSDKKQKNHFFRVLRLSEIKIFLGFAGEKV